MFSGYLVFAAPYILGFLAILPILWWLLRLTPPAPQKIIFPALQLLQGIVTPEKTPARTPWWLLLLRFLIATLLIIAFAQPLIDPQPVISGKGDMLIVIDNDWAAARAWDERQQVLKDLIRQAERENRSVLLLATTPSTNGDPLQIIGPLAAKAAYAEAARIAPQAWGADWVQAKNIVTKMDRSHVADAFWLASGISNSDAKAFYETMQQTGGVRAISDTSMPIYTLMPPHVEANPDPTAEKAEGISIAVMRAITDNPADISVAALAKDGHTLMHIPLHFTAGAPRAIAPLSMPLDIRNQIARFVVENQRTAAATVLVDASWQRRPVGLVGDAAELAQHSLLSSLFYIDRALKPYANIHVDKLDALLKQDMAVLVINDTIEINDAFIKPLMNWMQRGGLLVRFSGERLASIERPEESEILPVMLRTGDRAMGGSLSWSTPQKLRDFPAASPFRGLSLPEDVTINRQVLAEPSSDLASKSWATLEDGTPLVTAKAVGQGFSILFHVPARSDWSNLPLSGLFVDMLRRIVDLSSGVPGDMNFSTLPPYKALNGFGDDQQPGLAAQPISSSDFAQTKPGPQHPPGLYGNDTLNRAFNLGHAIGQPEALTGIKIETYKQSQSEVDLQPYLLMAGFILLLLDFLISLYLRGLLTVKLRASTAALFLISGFTFPAHAATVNSTPVEITAKTYLAYIETGNREHDRIAEAGLKGLANILQRRTSIDQVAVIGVDPNFDEIAFYPFLYWPLSANQPPLTPQGAARMNDYIHHGGMIVLDSMEGESLAPGIMQKILDGIDVPPLIKLPQEHVLKRSFYLLEDFPGRYAGNDVWLEPEEMSSYDGVATVISGTNGWAAAWALDEQGRPLYPCSPGGEMQRERAFRFGVNLVMYALTGNYKSDQIHAQSLLQRLGK